MSKRQALIDAKQAIMQDPTFLAMNGFPMPASTGGGEGAEGSSSSAQTEAPITKPSVGEQSQTKEASVPNGNAQASVPNQASQPAGSENANADGEDTGHPIPYTRFQKKVQQTNRLTAEVESLKKQIESLKRASTEQQPEVTQPRQQAKDKQEDWLADYFKDSTTEANKQEASDDPYAKRFEALESTLHAFKLDQAKTRVASELEAVKKEFPNLNVSTILTAYAQGHGNNLHEVAEALDDYEHQVEQRGIANYLKQSEKSQGSQLPPGWPKASASQRSSATELETSKPRNIKEAGAAALKYLQSLQ